MELSDIWPLHDLELRTPDLVLRPVRDDDIPGLVDAALAGIHPPERMPFSTPWTAQPPEVLARELARHQWRMRTVSDPDDWKIIFAILHDGVVIGSQDFGARGFGTLRTVTTGSWLTRSMQGRGFGAQMRAAVLLFAFDHLGAEAATSSALAWNAASLGVSASLGYERNGVEWIATHAGEREEHVRVRLLREEFRRPSWALDARGVDPVRRFLGIPG